MITWFFFGDEGVRALTKDEYGSNLPEKYSPWNKFRIIELNRDDPKNAPALAAIDADGYFLFQDDPDA